MLGDHPEFLRLYHKSVRHAWKLEDVASRDWSFDFSRPFMPDTVTTADEAARLGPELQLRLSQIRGNEYLSIIVLVEDAIIDFLFHFIAGRRFTLPYDTQQALTNFISEEMKHTLLFQFVQRKLEGGFGHRSRTIERMPAFSRFVLQFDPLGALLFILHSEVMTSINYVHAVATRTAGVDPYFAELLKFHWIEEAGHVSLDELLLDYLAQGCDEDERVRAVQEYFSLVDFLHGAMLKAGAFDLETLQYCPGVFAPVTDLHGELALQQRRFYVQSYVLDVMEAPRFRQVVGRLSDRALPLLDARIAGIRAGL